MFFRKKIKTKESVWLLKVWLLVMASLLLAACSGLQKTQITATEKFAIATKGISRTPSDIYYRISFLKSESQNLQLSSILATNDSVNGSLALLRENFNEQNEFIKLADQYSTAYYIIEKYTDLVLSLLKTSYMDGFLRSKPGWQSSFDNLVASYNRGSIKKIPSSVGNFTASLLQQIGKMKLGALQKKYLLEAITTAHEPFNNICNDFITLDSLKITSEIQNLPSFIDNNYGNFLENIRAYETGGNNPYYYFNSYTPIYNSWLTQVNEIKVLSSKSILAFRQLKVAYDELETFVSGNGKERPLPQLDELIVKYEDLRDTYRKFDNKRSKLTMSGFERE